jgi:hypothetical protein
VLDGYCAKILGESDIKRLLGFETRFEVHDFLFTYPVPFYTLEDLQHDRESSQRLGLSRWLLPTLHRYDTLWYSSRSISLCDL